MISDNTRQAFLHLLVSSLQLVGISWFFFYRFVKLISLKGNNKLQNRTSLFGFLLSIFLSEGQGMYALTLLTG